MDAIFETANQKLTAAYKSVDQSAILPTVLPVILDIVKALLANCNAPAQSVKDMAANPTTFSTFVVRRHVRQELRDRYGIGGYAQHHGDKIVSAILRAGADASPEEIEQLSQA